MPKKKRTKKPKPAKPAKRIYRPRIYHGPNGIKLKQIQYHKYHHDIPIYHTSQPPPTHLTRRSHGYVAQLLSTDPLHNKPVTDGDEIPAGCMEVVYLVDVFQHGGSAVGYRVGGDVVVWLCFEGDVRGSVLGEGGFDLVGFVWRPEGKKVRGSEHRAWNVALRSAGRRPVRLRVSWRRFESEMLVEEERKRKRERVVGGEDVDVDEDVWDDEEDEEEDGVYEEEEEEQQAQQQTTTDHEAPIHQPQKIHRHAHHIYPDPDPDPDTWQPVDVAISVRGSKQNASPKPHSDSHSRSSSSESSVLSDRHTNTVRPPQHPSTTKKGSSKETVAGEWAHRVSE
ncbi:hypothetical protein BDW02DRAFT_627802 [Decorospora gaudefroyi]|uniref:Uncharacterized protein n=1 Tax=Decorospora gaudefroyi TaxID=184978 RepID=A0A6A5KVM0_9PLEO|nr:hypothetical protein BDW02DRAFT_627802 [Decorospora gaudefroyi]